MKKKWLSLLLALVVAIMVTVPTGTAVYAEDGIAPMSLLPLEEVEVDLNLAEYSLSFLEAVPLQLVLNSLWDKDGHHVNIPEDATTVWAFITDSHGNVISDQQYDIMDNDQTIDLWYFLTATTRKFQLIVGSGNQLDPDNTRYIVTAHFREPNISNFEYELGALDENGNMVWDIEIYDDEYDGFWSWIEEQGGDGFGDYYTNLSAREQLYITDFDGPYYFRITNNSTDEWSKNIDIEVYTLEDYEKYLNGETVTPITDRIFANGADSSVSGYKGTFNRLYPRENTFIIEYSANGSVIDREAVMVSASTGVWWNSSCLTASVYSYSEETGMQDVVESADKYAWTSFSDNSYPYVNFWYSTYFGTWRASVRYSPKCPLKQFQLKKEIKSGDEVYFAISDIERSPGANKNIAKIIHGYYLGGLTSDIIGKFKSIEEAEGYEDIKDQVLVSEDSEEPYGYKIEADKVVDLGGGYEDDEDYSNLRDSHDAFVVFFEDGYIYEFIVFTDTYHDSYNSDDDGGDEDDETDTPITDDPLPVSYADPYLDFSGAVDLDTYKIPYDTYYRYGYQTFLVLNEDADISKVVPEFDVDTTGNGYAYANGERQSSGKSVVDFTENPVAYQVRNDSGVRNYSISYIQKAKGAKLFVNGPSDREVFLDRYFENVHDIIIANVGDQPLTNITVTLDAENVKLDEYWTVGGEGNNTLAAFTTVDADATEYGEIPNVAKIRLLADGEGEIDGTLTISADGQEPVVIKLNGYAGNPKIITKSIPAAVKYVPYSTIVATNNMHSWNKVTFDTYSNLPDGLTFNTKTGEIYGVPTETGSFDVYVRAYYSDPAFNTSYADLELTVNENTNDNVFNASDEDYEVLQFIGEQQGSSHEYVLNSTDNQLFVSNGKMEEFVDLWLNGEKLVEGEDYTVESGSTRLTIMSQTFENKVNTEGANTIAAEFRVNGDENDELKRTAQNFSMYKPSETPDDEEDNTGNGSNGTGSGSAIIGTDTGTGNGNDTSIDTGNSTGTGNNNGTNNANDPSTAPSVKYVSFSGYLVDPTGNSLPGLIVELHSEPKITVSDANGYFRFDNVEYGQHTLYIKDASGNVMASKTFNIIEGNSGIITVEDISAEEGSLISVEAEVNGDQIIFHSANTETTDRVPDTGSGIDIIMVCVLMGTFGTMSLTHWTRKNNR